MKIFRVFSCKPLKKMVPWSEYDLEKLLFSFYQEQKRFFRYYSCYFGNTDIHIFPQQIKMVAGLEKEFVLRTVFQGKEATQYTLMVETHRGGNRWN